MPDAVLVFGSSKDLLMPMWRVWTYDIETRSVTPLGEYRDQDKSQTAAFDLAHAVATSEQPTVASEILSQKDSDPRPLSEHNAGMFAVLAENAIRNGEVPREARSNISTSHTPFDTVHVVRVTEPPQS